MFVHSGGTERSVLHATVLIKSGKKESFDTYSGNCMELGKVTVDGGSITEIILLLIKKDVCEGG